MQIPKFSMLGLLLLSLFELTCSTGSQIGVFTSKKPEIDDIYVSEDLNILGDFVAENTEASSPEKMLFGFPFELSLPIYSRELDLVINPNTAYTDTLIIRTLELQDSSKLETGENRYLFGIEIETSTTDEDINVITRYRFELMEVDGELIILSSPTYVEEEINSKVREWGPDERIYYTALSYSVLEILKNAIKDDDYQIITENNE